MTARRRASSFLFAAGVLTAVSSASAACTHPKCSLDLNKVTDATVPVIVQYANDPSDSDVSILSNFGKTSRRLHNVKAVAATVSSAQLTDLANQPGVTFVSLDRKVVAHQIGTAAANGLATALTTPAAAALANTPAAALASVAAPATPATPTTSGQTSPIGTTPEFTAQPINAPWALAQNFNGQNIGVAVIDSGITVVADLGPTNKLGPARVVYSQNFVPNETVTTDAYGHGTHVAGLIAGNGAASTGLPYTRTFQGIAPKANLINLRVLDENGVGSDSAVIAAIQQAIALKNIYNIRIINLSLGRPIYESYTQDPLCQAVEQAWKAGIVVVVAAGNDGRDLNANSEGYGTINAPGNDPYVITVGATNPMNTATVSDDVMASYSSKGPSFVDFVTKPDIIAPGNLVTSLLAPGSNLQLQNPSFYTPLNWYTSSPSTTASTVYYPLSGTSMATAVASGAVADMLTVAGYLTPDQVKVLLMISANKTVIPQLNVITDPSSGASFTAHNDVFTQGAGYLDLQAAINDTWLFGYAIPTTGYAMSPIANFNAATGDVTLVSDATALWGRNVLTGTTNILGAGSVYGTNAFATTGASAVWGSTALWGRSDPQAFTALWGRDTTWSQGTPDAATALWGRDTTTGSTALWGRDTTTGSTALWGRDTSDASSAMLAR